MNPLEQFLTCLLKDLRENGYIETLKKHAESVIKSGFEIVTEVAVLLLNELIGACFPCFKTLKKKPVKNPIFNIIYNLIIDFKLNDLQTIILYIKAAIDLLRKLLAKYYNFNKKQEPYKTKEIILYEEMPLKRCRVCTSEDVNTMHKPVNSAENIPETVHTMHIPVNLAENIPETVHTMHIPVKLAESIPETGTINTSPYKTKHGILGTRKTKNTNFNGVEKKISYYVGRVSLTTSKQDVIDFLTDLIPDGYFECIKLTSNGKTQSFKVTANRSSKEGLENPENWPTGVYVRPWVKKNKNPTKARKNGIEVA